MIRHVLIGAVAGALTTAAVVPVAASMTSDVVHACATGEASVRLLDGPGSCLPGERSVEWNQEGPAGPPGLVTTYVVEASGQGTVTVQCDDTDDLLLGGGHRGDVFIPYTIYPGESVSAPRPDLSPQGWEAKTGHDTNVTAYAVCGDVGGAAP